MGIYITTRISSYAASLTGLALLVTAWAGETPAVAQEAPDKVVAAWVGELRSTGATVATAAMDVDRATNTVQLRGVKIAFPSAPTAAKLTIEIGRLDLTGEAESETRYAVRALKAEDVKVAYGDVSGAAQSLALSNVSVPKLSLKLRDPQHPFRSLLAFLNTAFQTSFDSLSIHTVKVPLGASPNSLFSVAGIEAANVHDGVVGKLELANLGVVDEPSTTQAQLGRLTFANVALKALTEAFAADSGEGQKQGWIALGDAISLESFDVRGPGRHIELPRATISGVRVRPFPAGVVDYFDSASADPQFVAQHPDERRKFAQSLLQAVKVDKVSTQNFAIDDAQSPVSRQLAVQNFEIADLDPLNAGSVTLSGLHGGNGDVGLTIDRVGVSGLHLIDVEPAKGSDAATPRLLYVAGGFLENLQLGKSGVFIKLQDLHFQSPEHVGVVPTAIDGALVGLTIPIQVVGDPNLRGLLGSLDLQSLAIDADFRANWDEPKEHLNVERVGVSVQNIGRLELEASISDVRRAALEHPESLLVNLASAGIERVRLRFEDKGFVTRVLNAYAVANKSAPDQIRRALSSNMPVILGAIPQPEVRNGFIFALVGFLNDPQVLDIVSTAPNPVPIAAFAAAMSSSPASIPGLLRLTAKSIRRPVNGTP